MNTKFFVDEVLVAQHRRWLWGHWYWTRYAGWVFTTKKEKALRTCTTAVQVAVYEAKQEAESRG